MAAQRKPFENAEGSMSKLKASEVAVRACEQAIQTMTTAHEQLPKSPVRKLVGETLPALKKHLQIAKDTETKLAKAK